MQTNKIETVPKEMAIARDLFCQDRNVKRINTQKENIYSSILYISLKGL